jgi:cytochrome c oxidase subunit II
MNELMRRLLFLPPQSSSIARELDYLHYFVISVTMVGAVAVTVVGGYYLLRYRERAPLDPRLGVETPARRYLDDIPVLVEVTAVLALLGLFLLWWYIGFAQFVRMRVPPERTLDVYVTGKQWMWNFAYPDGSGSSGTLYVPARTPVKLILTSRDVIHSFYVPDFRVKQDAVPGRFTTLWFEALEPGVHDVFCTEYCGLAHSMMRAQVVVVEPNRWTGGAPDADTTAPLVSEASSVRAPPTTQARPTLVELGERASVEYGCLRCHSIDGSPHIGPTWAALYGTTIPLQSGETVRADEAYLTASMMDPLAQLHRGYQPIMPSYFGVLPAPEAAAILEYIKALRDVAPSQDARSFDLSQGAAPPVPGIPEGTVAPLRPLPVPRDRWTAGPPASDEDGEAVGR